MKIGFDAKRYYHNHTGLGNYSRTLIGDMKEMFPQDGHVLYDARSWERTFRLGHRAAAEGCDLYHGLSNELPVDIGIPSVVTIHDVCWRSFPQMYHFLDRHIYDWKYGSSCRRADRIVAISESTKRDIIRYYGIKEEKIQVVYQPVSRNYYTPLAEDEKAKLVEENVPGLPADFILYVGSINKRKNLLAAVKALELIPSENRPLLLIIGNGHEYRREVEAYIASHNLGGHTRIVDSLHDNRALQALYAKARLMVYPSFYEGFGLPVVEAALQNTPVITTTVSSLPEAAGKDACLIDPHAADAVEQIAHHIDRLLGDTALCSRVASGMESYARQMFTPETLTKQMHDLYEILVR